MTTANEIRRQQRRQDLFQRTGTLTQTAQRQIDRNIEDIQDRQRQQAQPVQQLTPEQLQQQAKKDFYSQKAKEYGEKEASARTRLDKAKQALKDVRASQAFKDANRFGRARMLRNAEREIARAADAFNDASFYSRAYRIQVQRIDQGLPERWPQRARGRSEVERFEDSRDRARQAQARNEEWFRTGKMPTAPTPAPSEVTGQNLQTQKVAENIQKEQQRQKDINEAANIIRDGQRQQALQKFGELTRRTDGTRNVGQSNRTDNQSVVSDSRDLEDDRVTTGTLEKQRVTRFKDDPILATFEKLDTIQKEQEFEAKREGGLGTIRGARATAISLISGVGRTVVALPLMLSRPIQSVKAAGTAVVGIVQNPQGTAIKAKESILQTPISFASDVVGSGSTVAATSLIKPTISKISQISARIGAEKIPAEKIFDPRVLAGETQFPKTTSVAESIAAFRKAQTPEGKIEVITTSPAQIRGTEAGAGRKGGLPTPIEDAGIYVTPAGQGSPAFLRVQKPYQQDISISMNPLKDIKSAFDVPTATIFTARQVEQLPRSVVAQPGFQKVKEFFEQNPNQGSVFITKRSEIGQGELPRQKIVVEQPTQAPFIMTVERGAAKIKTDQLKPGDIIREAGTSELEAVIPFKQEFMPTESPRQFTIYQGATIQIKRAELLGSNSPTPAPIVSTSSAQATTIGQQTIRESELFSRVSTPTRTVSPTPILLTRLSMQSQSLQTSQASRTSSQPILSPSAPSFASSPISSSPTPASAPASAIISPEPSPSIVSRPRRPSSPTSPPPSSIGSPSTTTSSSPSIISPPSSSPGSSFTPVSSPPPSRPPTRGILPPPPRPVSKKSKKEEKEKEEGFTFIFRRGGKFIQARSVFGSEKEAKAGLLRKLSDTLAASGKIVKTNLKPNTKANVASLNALKQNFRRGKNDPTLIVERRGKRLKPRGRSQEVTEIQRFRRRKL